MIDSCRARDKGNETDEGIELKFGIDFSASSLNAEEEEDDDDDDEDTHIL